MLPLAASRTALVATALGFVTPYSFKIPAKRPRQREPRRMASTDNPSCLLNPPPMRTISRSILTCSKLPSECRSATSKRAVFVPKSIAATRLLFISCPPDLHPENAPALLCNCNNCRRHIVEKHHCLRRTGTRADPVEMRLLDTIKAVPGSVLDLMQGLGAYRLAASDRIFCNSHDITNGRNQNHEVVHGRIGKNHAGFLAGDDAVQHVFTVVADMFKN